jgi:thymidylate synthase
MADFYKPYEDRTPDSQYRDRIKFILENGTLEPTPQGVPALTCFGTLPAMVFDLSNGAPVITDRSLKNFWPKAIIEIIAFVHGVRNINKLIELGCDYWKDYLGKGVKHGLAPEDLGPGSYGAAFHDFPMPNGDGFNQYEALIPQIQERPELRTHFVSPWIPYYAFRGLNRKVVVSTCHGWQQYRVLGGKLHLLMWQRSADLPIGVPSNMTQYAAMLLMVARATGYEPGMYVHQFGDAHIYENQIDKMLELVEREPKRLPTLTLSPDVHDFFSITANDFELTDYDPHPGMKISYLP